MAQTGDQAAPAQPLAYRVGAVLLDVLAVAGTAGGAAAEHAAEHDLRQSRIVAEALGVLPAARCRAGRAIGTGLVVSRDAGVDLRGVPADMRHLALDVARNLIAQDRVAHDLIAAAEDLNALQLDGVAVVGRIDAAVVALDGVGGAGPPLHGGQVAIGGGVEGGAAVVHVDSAVVGAADVDGLDRGDLLAVDGAALGAGAGTVADRGAHDQRGGLRWRDQDALHAGLGEGRGVIVVIAHAAVEDAVAVQLTVLEVEHPLEEGVVGAGGCTVPVIPG